MSEFSRMILSCLVACLLAGVCLSGWLLGQESRPPRPSGGLDAVVRDVDFDGRIRIAEVGWIQLQGIEAPHDKNAKVLLRKRLLALLAGQRARIDFEGVDAKGFRVALVRVGTAYPAETVLSEGLAWFRTRTRVSTEQRRFVAACARAKKARSGLWKTPAVLVDKSPPLQRGGVLGLYFKVDRPYHIQVDRVAATGAEWIQLLLTVFVSSVESDEITYDKRRTVSDARLRETIQYARKKGLRVALLPIVLLADDTGDDWRGTLRPKNPSRFWQSYDDFMARYLDIARDEGVDLFYVGSELCSLESSHAAWKRVIENARGRYGGWLGYSANWDHYDVPRFWPLLDQVGLTAYFELTEDKDASLEQLVAAWRKVRKDLAVVAKKLGRKLVLTELGYASQDGVNTAPWNYYLTDKIDLEEQADCFRAFDRVMSDAPWLDGVYVFGFFEKGGRDDSTYTVWGKPAFDVVKKMLRRLGK